MNWTQIMLIAALPLVADDAALLPLWLALLWYFHEPASGPSSFKSLGHWAPNRGNSLGSAFPNRINSL
jgi:hypothetical protein